ncbi:sulfohydrolase/Glycosulfatase, Zn-dependent hydrolase, putative [Trichomonas vaginalis G3]|uniref:Sulphohydrolase/Glycosulfatase, Zn-dependent hydrolase, putative n=1 Tax=Trichomonas vaginalis (strain ATCC PRA-98 / G3) TaxID=412133 RepID=A2DRU4_TRIV3|nr:metallo-hydrolase/oxidoreductase family [Trichomonas vaginalis G3]EAY16891.1 sulfohydrolase/Glycosulfatase, Zn-dependent hydrolase, putative [Trichomonas vaginalis G3]KAI5489122.1 metallo-hydrolase/oxidoreductase family [Trichomonas vaginalis G3]|eukprot:XP_001329114.1 Sulphohydrolase/Glycosulfatase, Zn-dependent hydrolase [Trichomonas vaginalis G3]
MKLIVLGSGGYYTTDDTHTPSYMIPELGIIFDSGNGIHRAPQYVETETIHIFLSHAHLDHTEGLRVVNYLYNDKCTKIIVHARKEIIEAIPLLFNQPFAGGHTMPFELEEVEAGKPIQLQNGVTITAFELNHTSPNFGYRLDTPKRSMAYVTDTTFIPEKDYTPHLHNLDLLLHECYATAGDVQQAVEMGHTCPEQFVSICKATNPKKAYTIHHRPKGGKEENIEFIKKEFPNAFMAVDKQIIEF